MKKKFFLLVFWLFFLYLFFIYIYLNVEVHRSNVKEKEFNDSLAVEKQRSFDAFVDSIGDLSFYNIKLSSSFTNTINNIKNDNLFENIQVYNNSCSADVKIFLPDCDQSTSLKLHIHSHLDTIYNISLVTENYCDSKKLEKMYIEKYKLKYANEYNREDEEKYVWIFNEQSISLCTNYLVYKDSYNLPTWYILKFSGKTKIRDSNLYFDYFEVEYENIPISNEVSRLSNEKYERMKNIEKQKMIEKQKRDSIENMKRKTELMQNI